MWKGNPLSGGNSTRDAHGCSTAIRGKMAKTAVAALMTLAGCGDGQHPEANAHAAAGIGPDRWTDRHGNVCECVEPGLARCRTPAGRVWYREDAPTPGSLLRDPVKAMMWTFARGRDVAANGSCPNARDTEPGVGN